MRFVPYREWHDRFVEHYEGFSSRLHVDEATGHGRFEPMPDAALLDRFYNGSFTRSDSPPTPQAEFTPEVIDIVTGMCDYVREITGLPETFTYHDVGCGFGAGVWAAQQLGLQATGNEANRTWVEAANPHCRGALSAEPLEQVLAGLGHQVDVFFSSHVLEHVADPGSILALMAQHISSRGVAYLCMPNTHSLRAMLGGRRGDPAYQFPMHLNYFTPRSLCVMLREVGLEPIQIETRALDEIASDGRSPLDCLMETPRPLQVDDEAWQEAVCANLLGGGLFVLATRPDNTTARRDPDLDRKVELAFERFAAARRVPLPDVRKAAKRQARRVEAPTRRAVKRVAYPTVRALGFDPKELVARLRKWKGDDSSRTRS